MWFSQTTTLVAGDCFHDFPHISSTDIKSNNPGNETQVHSLCMLTVYHTGRSLPELSLLYSACYSTLQQSPYMRPSSPETKPQAMIPEYNTCIIEFHISLKKGHPSNKARLFHSPRVALWDGDHCIGFLSGVWQRRSVSWKKLIKTCIYHYPCTSIFLLIFQ